MVSLVGSQISVSFGLRKLQETLGRPFYRWVVPKPYVHRTLLLHTRTMSRFLPFLFGVDNFFRDLTFPDLVTLTFRCNRLIIQDFRKLVYFWTMCSVFWTPFNKVPLPFLPPLPFNPFPLLASSPSPFTTTWIKFLLLLFFTREQKVIYYLREVRSVSAPTKTKRESPPF